jgi:predicted RNase H-like HicB family nuclease
MIEVFYSDEDAGYIARLSDQPGLSAWGATFLDAVREILVVIALCKEQPALI